MEPAPTLEPSVRDVFRSPQSDAYAGVEAFARRVVHRHRPVGGPGVGSNDRLTREIESRWTLPHHLFDGLEVLDAAGFAALAREWQEREGYADLVGGERGPFVIPVDPVEAPAGLMATSARRGRGHERLRAFAPVAVPQTPRRMPVARERWRSAGRGSFSPYPSRLGNAGRIDGTLLRFPEARALTADAERRSIIVSDAPATSWGFATSSTLTPATRSAEHLAADVVARATPGQTTPVGLWLVPPPSPDAAASTRSLPFAASAPPLATRTPGRWQGGALSSVLYAPATTETFTLGAVAQRFLDAPPATPFVGVLGGAEVGTPRVGYADFDAVTDRSVVAPRVGHDAPSGLMATATEIDPRHPASVSSGAAAGRPTSPTPLRRSDALLATQPLVLRSAAALTGRRVDAIPAAALAGAPLATVSDRRGDALPTMLAMVAIGDVEPGGGNSRAFAVPALSAPTTGRLASAALPRLARDDSAPKATRAALAALSAPLAVRLAADAQEAGDAIDLGHRRFELSPLAPEYWTGLDVADPTLVAPAAQTTAHEAPGSAVSAERAASFVRSPDAAPRRTPPARLVPATPAGVPTPPQRDTAASVRPMTRAAIAPVLLPLLATAGLSSLVVAASRPARDRARSLSDLAGTPETHRGALIPERGTTPGAVPGPMGVSPAPARDSVRAASALVTPAAPVFEAFATLGALGPSLPLAAAGAAGPLTGPAADTLAARIEARFPTDTAGAWGPRVVLAPAMSALTLDAPETTWVAPVVPEAVPVEPEPPATGRARTAASAAALSTSRPNGLETAGSVDSRPSRRTPTLLSPARTELPGVLSPASAHGPSAPRTAPREDRLASPSGRVITPEPPDVSRAAVPISDAAPAGAAARSSLVRLIAEGAFGLAEARSLRSALHATGGAMPLGVALSTPGGFAAMAARSWSAAAAALSFAALGHPAEVLAGTGVATGERALQFADEHSPTVGGGALFSEPAASRLAESGEVGALVQADASAVASPVASNDTTAPLSASSPTGPRLRSAGRSLPGHEPIGPGLDVGLAPRSEIAVLRLAGHAVLVPAAAVAALRSAGTRPALLGALARLGSPALSSLLAADAPEAVYVDRGAATATVPVEEAATTVEARVAAAHRRSRSRTLLAAGFHEPRGLHMAGPAPVRAHAGRRAPFPGAATGADGTIRSSLAVFDAPSLSTLVLPPGIEAVPGPLSGAVDAAYAPGNVERALVAFEQVAARHPDAAGQNGPGPHATASALLRAAGTARGGSAGILATPSEVPHSGAVAGGSHAVAEEARALVQPQSAPQRQPLFGSRGPSVTVHSAAAPTTPRVMIETGARRSGGAAPLRSTDGERPTRQAETGEQARHRLAEGQIEESLSPEEVDKIAHEVISQLKRQIELDAIRVGEDEWD